MPTPTMTLPIIDQPVECFVPAQPPLANADAVQLADRLKALADPMRLQLLSLVMACDPAASET